MERKLQSISLILLLSFSPWLSFSQSTVRSLPGFTGPLPFHLETGYIGVGELEEDQLFYYFVESEKNPKEDPLLLWLTGGPGCSAWSGFVYGVGPLQFEKAIYNGTIPKLVLRPHAWTKGSSIIFLDSPVWTGFSYSRGWKDEESGDIKSSQEVYEFLRKWLMGHPQFLLNPLYLSGDSYSGITIPVIAHEIANGIEAGHEPILNLKKSFHIKGKVQPIFRGYLLANPATDYRLEFGSKVPYAHGMGLISDELYESAKKNCEGDYTKKHNPKCVKDLEVVGECISRVSKYHILEPLCPPASPKPKWVRGDRRSLENSTDLIPPLPSIECWEYRFSLSYYWADFPSVRKALHIRKGTVGAWKRCNYGLRYIKDVKSTITYHFNLTTRGYRALIYSGDHDLLIPFISTQAWIRSLNFTIVDDWRAWTTAGQVAGYTRTYSNNLTFATVKGAGHTAPEYSSKECFQLFQRWISHNPL